jgi:hypothetical protein
VPKAGENGLLGVFVVRNEKKMREEFELALIDVLETDFDLDVRRERDPLNRRKESAATLRFDYPTNRSGSRSKVVVQIEGMPESHSLDVDWSSLDGIDESAGDCESLAMAIGTWLEERNEARMLAVAGGGASWPQRRWDD